MLNNKTTIYLYSVQYILKKPGEGENMAYCQNCGNPVIGDVCQNCGTRVNPMQSAPQQTQPAPSKPPSKNVTKLLAVIAVVVVIILILSIMFFAFSDETDEDKLKGTQVEMTDINEMDLQSEGQITGKDAEDMREAIDEYFGDDDGQVTEDEVKDYEEEMADLKFAFEYTINFEEGKYSEYIVSTRNVEGDVESDFPISISLTATVKWPSLELFKDFYIIEVLVSNLEEKQYSFTAPTGYEIYRVDGLVEDISEGSTSFAGTVDEKFNYVYVTIIETGSNPQPADAEPNNTNYTANSVSNGEEIFGRLDDGIDEDDYYSIYAGSWNSINVDLNGPEGPNFDLRLYNSDGDQVDSSTNDYSDEYLSHYTYSSGSGTYYIRVQTKGGSGPYIMTVEVN
jgi:hypothetical protein